MIPTRRKDLKEWKLSELVKFIKDNNRSDDYHHISTLYKIDPTNNSIHKLTNPEACEVYELTFRLNEWLEFNDISEETKKDLKEKTEVYEFYCDINEDNKNKIEEIIIELVTIDFNKRNKFSTIWEWIKDDIEKGKCTKEDIKNGYYKTYE